MALLPQINAPRTQFLDTSGSPLAGGSVSTYVPGTTTGVTTYQDPDGTTANTNPITLDSQGSCSIYYSGQLRLIIADSGGTTIYDEVGGVGNAAVVGLFTSIGSLNIPIGTDIIQTSGYANRGIGAAIYTVGATTDPPAPAGVCTTNSLNGRPVYLLSSPASPEMAGAVPGSDCTAATQALSNYLTSLGGGTILFSSNSVYYLQNLNPTPYVTYEGQDETAIIRAQDPSPYVYHPFQGSGSDRTTYYLRNWKALNAVTAGNLVACTNSGDFSHFPAGSYILVCSTAIYEQPLSGGPANGDWQPVYCIPNKVIGNNGINLTLETPIFDDIGGAQIALMNDFTSSMGMEYWAIHNTFRNLTIDLTPALPGVEIQPFAIETWYQSLVDNCRIYGAWAILSTNSFSYSEMRNVRSYNQRVSSTNGVRFFEIKTGAYSSYIHHVFGDIADTATVSAMPVFIDIGEYASRINIEDCEFHAPNITNTFYGACNISGTAGDNIIVRRIKGQLAGCDAFVLVGAPLYTTKPTAVGIEYSDMRIESLACSQALTVDASQISSGVGSLTFKASRIHCVNAPAAPSGSGFQPACVLVKGVSALVDCIVDTVEANAPIWINNASPFPGSPVSLDIVNCKAAYVGSLNGYNPATAVQPWQLNIRNTRRYEEELVNQGSLKNKSNTGLSISSTTPNNVAAQTGFPAFASFGWSAGDRIEVDITVQVSGTAGAKHFRLVDVGAARTLVTIDATASQVYNGSGANAGTWHITGTLVYNGATGTYTGNMTTVGGGVIGGVASVTQLSAVASMNLQLQAWTDNSADGVYITDCNIYPRLAYGTAA